MKDKLHNTFLFTLLVVVGLFALHFLPVLRVGDTTLRRVDLLSDIRPPKAKKVLPMPADSDTIAPLPLPARPVFVDTCKAGVTCIEDYSDSTGTGGMRAFYAALSHIHTLGRPVRIAYFGDSFIEADILTGDLRALLQERFGGCGVGYVPVTSRFTGYRPTVIQSFSKGWSSHTITDSIGFERSLQDMSNHYFIPSSGASVTLRGQRKYASRLDTCEVSSFYFVSADSITVTAKVNDRVLERYRLPGDSVLQVASVEGRIGKVQWTVEKADAAARCFAVTMDARSGIVLDNFSTRGSSGIQLEKVPSGILADYARQRTYDLIVLQYGLNVASEGVLNYSYYTDKMVRVVRHLQEAFPQASFLIVGVGDRQSKEEETGELQTMPGIQQLIRYQQALAAKTHVAFWNLFDAMGGEGSIRQMVESKPQMANYDYTHINFRGGKHVATLLFDALVYGHEQYERQMQYENE